jgi:hypothetical protein
MQMHSAFKAAGAVLMLAMVLDSRAGHATPVEYPQIVKMRYEAADQKQGGVFTIWLDRATIVQGVHQQLYPGASYVEVTFVTPSIGSPPLTFIEVRKINSPVSEYYHIGGIVRFKVENMPLKSTNMPAQ